MSGKFKDSRFYQKLRGIRVNRAALLTVLTVVIIASAIVGITIATNRANKKEPPVETDTPVLTEPETPQESVAGTPDSEPTVDADAKLPTFSLPVTGVLATKHDPELQVYSPTMEDFRVHLGIDINTTEGAPVYAAQDGVVARIWEDALMGNCIAVSHAGDSCTVYKNLAKTYAEGIKEGAEVTEGQLLGAVGDSAMLEIAAEPHLHFEMTVGGIQVDPLKHFTENAVATLTQGEDAYEK